MSEPSKIAVAIGLAALGRRVICARPWDEPTRDTEAAVLEAIGFNAAFSHRREAMAFSYRREVMVIAHEPTGGCVVMINAGTWERARGGEFHHMIGGVWLRPDQRAILKAQLRLVA